MLTPTPSGVPDIVRRKTHPHLVGRNAQVLVIYPRKAQAQGLGDTIAIGQGYLGSGPEVERLVLAAGDVEEPGHDLESISPGKVVVEASEGNQRCTQFPADLHSSQVLVGFVCHPTKLSPL
ncbi:hypothetical protein PG988_011448 [Apiospora saccharicola]